MFKALFDRFRTRRVPLPPAEATALSPTALVEKIWSSWRYEKLAPQLASEVAQVSAIAAEQVKQLKRLGEYEKALRVALDLITKEERDGRRSGGRSAVPWYYWEAATIYRKLKRFNGEIALIRRFARNYDIHFRSFSKRYQSRSGAHQAWATKFLERLETAKAAAAKGAENQD